MWKKCYLFFRFWFWFLLSIWLIGPKIGGFPFGERVSQRLCQTSDGLGFVANSLDPPLSDREPTIGVSSRGDGIDSNFFGLNFSSFSAKMFHWFAFKAFFMLCFDSCLTFGDVIQYLSAIDDVIDWQLYSWQSIAQPFLSKKLISMGQTSVSGIANNPSLCTPISRKWWYNKRKFKYWLNST